MLPRDDVDEERRMSLIRTRTQDFKQLQASAFSGGKSCLSWIFVNMHQLAERASRHQLCNTTLEMLPSLLSLNIHHNAISLF